MRKTGRAAPNSQENPFLESRGPRRGIKMPKMADLGSGGAKTCRAEGAERENLSCQRHNRPKRPEKAVLDRPPSPEAMVGKQMEIESQRVAKWGERSALASFATFALKNGYFGPGKAVLGEKLAARMARRAENGPSDASERRPYLLNANCGCGRDRSPSGPLASGARVATGGEMGRGIGVVGRGCIPGGIGAEKRPASRPARRRINERLAHSRSRGKKYPKRRVWGGYNRENLPRRRRSMQRCVRRLIPG